MDCDIKDTAAKGGKLYNSAVPDRVIRLNASDQTADS